MLGELIIIRSPFFFFFTKKISFREKFTLLSNYVDIIFSFNSRWIYYYSSSVFFFFLYDKEKSFLSRKIYIVDEFIIIRPLFFFFFFTIRKRIYIVVELLLYEYLTIRFSICDNINFKGLSKHYVNMQFHLMVSIIFLLAKKKWKGKDYFSFSCLPC